MSEYKVTDIDLINIADSIRKKSNTFNTLLFPNDYISIVNAIELKNSNVVESFFDGMLLVSVLPGGIIEYYFNNFEVTTGAQIAFPTGFASWIVRNKNANYNTIASWSYKNMVKDDLMIAIAPSLNKFLPLSGDRKKYMPGVYNAKIQVNIIDRRPPDGISYELPTAELCIEDIPIM